MQVPSLSRGCEIAQFFVRHTVRVPAPITIANQDVASKGGLDLVEERVDVFLAITVFPKLYAPQTKISERRKIFG